MPLFLIERQFAELVPTDSETMATVKQVNDEIGIQWLFSFLSADKRAGAHVVGAIARRVVLVVLKLDVEQVDAHGSPSQYGTSSPSRPR